MMSSSNFGEFLNLIVFFLFGFLFASVCNLLVHACKLILNMARRIASEINSARDFREKPKEHREEKRKRTLGEHVIDFVFSFLFGIGYLLLSYCVSDGSFRLAHLLAMLSAFLLGKRLLFRPIGILLNFVERILSVVILPVARLLTRLYLFLVTISSKMKKYIEQGVEFLLKQRKNKLHFHTKMFKSNKKGIK